MEEHDGDDYKIPGPRSSDSAMAFAKYVRQRHVVTVDLLALVPMHDDDPDA